MIARPILSAVLVLGLLLATPWRPSAADLVDAAAPKQLSVERGKSLVLRTSTPISRMSVADPSIADVSLLTPTQILVTASGGVGATNLILWHGEARVDVYELEVSLPDGLAASIDRRLQELVPEGDVRVLPGRDGVLLDGTVPSMEHQQRVLAVAKALGAQVTNLMRVGGDQQVQLQVRVAEVSRSGLRRMGLSFLISDEFTLGVIPAGDVSGEATSAEDTIIQSALTALTPFASAFQIAAFDDDFLSVLSLLREQGFARLLASPTLVSMSGQQASFLVGGEFAVPVAVRDGVTSIEFKEFGTLLRFTPTVVAPETISLRVEPEVSNTDESLGTVSGGVAVPGVRTRRAAATLQLKDGQTFVMAGLLQEENSLADGRLPFLGDIPGLGTLFTRKEARTDETELVIAVTARLARAVDREPALPGDDWAGDVSDVDFFLLNRTMAPPREDEPVRATGTPEFSGPFGFSE